MLKMVDGRFVASCASLACAILSLFFFLRSDNVFFTAIDPAGISTAFAFAELAIFAVCGLAFCFVSRMQVLVLSTPGLIASGVALCLGALSSCFIPAVPQEFALLLAVASACCVAFGSTLLVSISSANLGSFSPARVLAAALLSFLSSSVVWYALARMGDSLFAGACIGIGGLASAASLARVSLRASSQISSPLGMRDVFEATTTWQRYGFAAFGLFFSFFTMGLTFWPQDAGVPGDSSVSGKSGPYILVAIVAWALMRLFARRGGNDGENVDRVLLTMLPLATAIALVSPFIDSVFAEAPFLVLNLLPYAGIAGLNVIGYVSAVRASQSLGISSVPVFGAVIAGCAICMGAGMVLFSLIGSQAQMVSLTILTMYLATMIVASVQSEAFLAGPAKRGGASLETICARIAESRALSPRETEILVYLARGRGARRIGDKLGISPETVRTHMKRIYEKCGVHAKEELLDLLEEEARKTS